MIQLTFIQCFSFCWRHDFQDHKQSIFFTADSKRMTLKFLPWLFYIFHMKPRISNINLDNDRDDILIQQLETGGFRDSSWTIRRSRPWAWRNRTRERKRKEILRYSNIKNTSMDVLGIEPRTAPMRMGNYTTKPNARNFGACNFDQWCHKNWPIQPLNCVLKTH